MSSLPSTSTLPHSSTPLTSSNGLPQIPPSNSQIEAVIQMATSAASSPASRTPGRDTRTQLFVGNLPYRVRWQDLKDLFRKSGTVLRADVSLGPDNRSRGYGTVLLATAEDAARAVEMFNGYNWQTRTLEVRPDRLPPDFEKQGHLPSSNPNSLPSSSAAPTFPLPLQPQPYAPPHMDHPTTGVDDFEVSKLFGVDWPRAPSSAGSRNLFVGNLPFHCQWQDLKDLFRQAGTIVRADVALGPDGRSRGFGTVSFANDPDAERALSLFNGYEYNGRTLKVHYDKYSQGQPSQSPIPPPPLSTSSPALHHTHPSAPTHIPIPMPPPLAAFEHIASGHQSPSQRDNPFGQISPYDLFPPHIAAIAANATAQAYMNKQPHSPPAIPPTTDPVEAVSISTASAILSSTESNLFAFTPQSKPTDADPISHTTPPGRNSTQNPVPTPSTHNPTPIPAQDIVPTPSTHSAATTPSAHNHPHPGPIALPSPPIHSFPHVPGPVSPLQGLPPITPSMPSFTFVPQNATPPLSAHFLSPGVGLSPFSPTGTMSPGAFYRPPPNQRHPLGQVWNVAPGAPLHLHSPVGSPGSPGFYPVHAQVGTEGGIGLGMNDYFSAPPPPPAHVAEGYFPPMSVLRGSGLSSEISTEGASAVSGDGTGASDVEQKTSVSVPGTSDGSSSLSSDLGLEETRACGRSSAGTSLEGGDIGEEVKQVEEAVQGFCGLSLGEDGSEPRVPHRTHSDGGNATSPSTPSRPGGAPSR